MLPEMSGPEVESRQSFPTYAELAQTAAWGQGQAAVQVDPHDRTGSFALAQHERYTEGALLGTGGMGRGRATRASATTSR